MQHVFGILLMVAGVASGLLIQDPVVCIFNQSNQCYVALGRRLHLRMPLEEEFNLKMTDKTSTDRVIIKYRKSQTNLPTPSLPGWRFVNDSKTMIVTSAEKSHSGTYTLEIIDANGKTKGNYNLQLNVEAEVSSVEVSYSCLSPEVMTVSCSAKGENLQYNWTTDTNTLTQPVNRDNTLTLNRDFHGKVTCHVENHVSRDHNTTELQPCSEPTTKTATTPGSSTPAKIHGTNSTVRHNPTNSTEPNSPMNTNSWFLKIFPIILGSVCVLLIVSAVLAFCVYNKRQNQMKKQASSQDGGELTYAHVTHLPKSKRDTRPALAQDEEVEYATVVGRETKKKQKKVEDEVQYGELVFNSSAKKQHKTTEVQDDCVYSQVKRGQ